VEANGPVTGETLTGDGALIATGHEPFNAERKPRYGYERLRKVFTGTEAEQLLNHQSYLTAPDENVAFIQCVGSRDPQIGRNYCSAVCCSYALRIAGMLKYRNPDASITIYYIDIQNFDKNFTRFKQQLVDMGVSFVRGLPFKVEELAGGALKLLREVPDGDGESIVEHDAVVLSVGLGPADEADALAEQFGLARDAFGFFETETPNVFVSGTCKAPMSIPESIASAKATALEMGKYAHE
jgi:heterodisulfide reductase subunit A